ncbi:hypothetical protein L3Q82_013465 [Scortum barcoo]|uniref:Uncharacterized protein n=1 Tax=Scortum barcoo TaxID=214431 RepID=A0ACB8W271_9TELE|nr:hypothetical protein L3Q82_013465 [Scortum barcoo]
MMDKGVLEPALGKEQSFTEQAPLVADDGVQRVAGIVHNIQQFVQSPRLCQLSQLPLAGLVVVLKSEVYRVKRRGASTVPWGAPVLLTTVSGRDVLQPDVLWSASEMGVGSMEQVEDGILHANTWLVGELQAILGVLAPGV